MPQLMPTDPQTASNKAPAGQPGTVLRAGQGAKGTDTRQLAGAGCPSQVLATRPAAPLAPATSAFWEGAPPGWRLRLRAATSSRRPPEPNTPGVRGKVGPECQGTRDTGPGAPGRAAWQREGRRARRGRLAVPTSCGPCHLHPGRPEDSPPVPATRPRWTPVPPPTPALAQPAHRSSPASRRRLRPRPRRPGRAPKTLRSHSQSRAAPGSEAGATHTSVNPWRVC